MKMPPCKKYKERYPHCHSKCEKYLTWKKEHNAMMDRKRNEDYVASYDALSRARTAKRSKNHGN